MTDFQGQGSHLSYDRPLFSAGVATIGTATALVFPASRVVIKAGFVPRELFQLSLLFIHPSSHLTSTSAILYDMANVHFYSMDDLQRDMSILGRPEPPEDVASVDPLWIMGRVHAQVNPYEPTHVNPNPPPRPPLPPSPPRVVRFAFESDTTSTASSPSSASTSSASAKSSARSRRSSRKPVRYREDSEEDTLIGPPRGSFGSPRKVLGGGVSRKTRSSKTE